jgi:hypothetical protein
MLGVIAMAGCSDDETTTAPPGTTSSTGGGSTTTATGNAGSGGAGATGSGGGAGPGCVVEDLSFTHQVIDDGGPVDPWQKITGDMNGDGQIDLLAGGRSSGGLHWYESPSWTRHEIAPGGGHSTDGETADVDGDLDLDVVSVTTSSLVWYENPGWAETTIESRTLHDVEVADFDGDGDVDAVARNQGAFSGSGDALHFYAQQSPTSWTHRAVTIPNGEGLLVVDIDDDGDDDVVVPGRWYENTGDILSGPWTEHVYTSDWNHHSGYVAAGDFDGDGRLDIVLSPSELAGETYRIAWFQAPVDRTSSGWAEQVVEADVEAVHHFVGAADFDGDGNLDVATAEMHQGDDPDEVKVYLNGSSGTSWTKVVVATTGSHSMRVVDANGDGFFDLFGANHQGDTVELWTNVGCTP